jgi:hypothetical protein
MCFVGRHARAERDNPTIPGAVLDIADERDRQAGPDPDPDSDRDRQAGPDPDPDSDRDRQR